VYLAVHLFVQLGKKHSDSISEYSAILTAKYLVPEIEYSTPSSAMRKIQDQ
jgi:hypothetical protein